jgi:hypothetical protein
MEFFINKNATLPVLKMQVVKDGRSDYHSFMNLIEKSGIFFSMVNVETGIPKITSKAAGFVSKVFDDPNTPTEYYIFYKFSKKDTQKTGRYEGQFLLKNDEGDLIIPIREKLYINVNDSLISDENCCSDQSYLTPCPDCPQCPECPQLPTPTPTPTLTSTPTPTTTPEPIIITLETIITPGSLNIDYNLYSNRVVNEDVNLSFTNTYGTSNGDVVITTGVTINSGYTSGTTHVYLPDVDFNTLNGYVNFSGVTLTPSITNPDNIIIEQIILDAILQTDINEYIDVYNDFYLSFVDPTPTPTPTLTSTSTPTPTTTPIISFSFSVRRNNTGPCTASTVTTIYSNSSVLEPGVSVYNDAALTSPIPSSAYICDCGNSVQYFISPTGIISYGFPGICVGITPTPTETETPTPTPTPTPTATSIPPYRYYNVNGYSCGNPCNFAGTFTAFVPYNTPLTIGYFYNNPENRGYSFEILDELATSGTYDLTGEPGYSDCVTSCYGPTPTPTQTPTQTPTPTPTPTLTLTPNCVRQIVVPTLWDGATSINSNTLKLTQTSETLQIQVNDVITDNIGRTSIVGVVSSDGTYTYVFTGAGGGFAFDCQFPLTFSGTC